MGSSACHDGAKICGSILVYDPTLGALSLSVVQTYRVTDGRGLRKENIFIATFLLVAEQPPKKEHNLMSNSISETPWLNSVLTGQVYPYKKMEILNHLAGLATPSMPRRASHQSTVWRWCVLGKRQRDSSDKAVQTERERAHQRDSRCCIPRNTMATLTIRSILLHKIIGALCVSVSVRDC